jgi:hypothetical protein
MKLDISDWYIFFSFNELQLIEDIRDKRSNKIIIYKR